MACKIIKSGGKKRKVCWRGSRLSGLGRIKSNSPYSGKARVGAWVSEGASGVGATKGRKRRVKRRRKRKSPSVRRTTTARRSTTPNKTFKAKRSYAITGLGKLRKGCRKIKKNGRTEYRCTMPGRKAKKRRARR